MYLKTKMSKVYERACVTAGSILKDRLLALASSFFGRFSWSMRRHLASTLLRVCTPVGVIGWLVGLRYSDPSHSLLFAPAAPSWPHLRPLRSG